MLAAFTNSDEDGGLDGACYYSRICVRKEDADQYKNGGSFSIENIEGKSFSFVSATSTSGFKVPSSGIVTEFGSTALTSCWKAASSSAKCCSATRMWDRW